MTRERLVGAVADRIANLALAHPTRVAIDGVDAAGKTTFGGELARALSQRGRPAVAASVDDWLHPRAHRYRQGERSAEGYYRDSFDYERLVSLLLAPLGPGGHRRVRTAFFDLEADRPLAAPLRTLAPDAVLVMDGIFLLRPELHPYWDCSIFLHADFDTTLARAKKRDRARFGGDAAVAARYRERYIPGQRIYLAECDPAAIADVVIDNVDPARPVVLRESGAEAAT